MSDKLSRREFIAQTTTTAAGIALASTGFTQNTKPITRLGTGSLQYDCIHDWIVPPQGMIFGDTHGVAQDSKGRIYVAHTVNGASQRDEAVCVYDEKGNFLNAWGKEFRGGAHGLDLRKEGNEEFIYHCDTARSKVVKTKLDGTVVWELGTPFECGIYKEGVRYVPTNVAFCPNGDFFIGDGYGSSYIHKYTKDGQWIKTWGGYGSEPGRMKSPHGLWVDTRGKEPMLAVADRENNRIQYFDLDGHHVRFDKEGMRRPCHFSLRKGMMLVPDLNSVVTILDEHNKVAAQLGDGDPSNLRGATRDKFINGKFIHPHDAMFLRNGDILVAEWVPIGRVTLLRQVK